MSSAPIVRRRTGRPTPARLVLAGVVAVLAVLVLTGITTTAHRVHGSGPAGVVAHSGTVGPTAPADALTLGS
ncbi:hypothetical protein [Pseudonocardia phyllosphaerae]|uniref:hypothetical protein n=1 Tax=Pseudonocardia phyllosphaerae TaxID=3390502 RepID=UPI00397BE9F4